jgi:peptidoglycan/LPS O-acetylase OafA/YrhL
VHRIRQLDGIRALAILAVFVSHAARVRFLWMGVDVFFVLSGFLITGVLLDHKQRGLGVYLRGFYERRARRILAPYGIFLVLASVVIGVGWMHYWYFYIFLANLLQPLHISFPGAFGPLWSLAVEEQFYLVWPLAVYLLSERALGRLCVGLMMVAPLLRGAFHFADHYVVYELTPFRMDLLAAGGLLCLVWRNRRDLVERWGTKIGLLLAAAGYAGLRILAHSGMYLPTNTRTSNVLVFEASLVTSLGLMVYALGGRGVGWLKVRPLTYIGQISYSMYLVHIGIIVAVFTKFHGWIAGPIAFALTVAYAAISWSLMEKRLLNRRNPAQESKLTVVSSAK